MLLGRPWTAPTTASAYSKFGADDCTPELAKVKIHWKRSLTIPVKIHSKSDHPLDSATEEVKIRWEATLNINWQLPLKSPLISEVLISGVKYFAPSSGTG